MICTNKDHDRFQGVVGAKSGCLACQYESLRGMMLDILYVLDAVEDGDDWSIIRGRAHDAAKKMRAALHNNI